MKKEDWETLISTTWVKCPYCGERTLYRHTVAIRPIKDGKDIDIGFYLDKLTLSAPFKPSRIRRIRGWLKRVLKR